MASKLNRVRARQRSKAIKKHGFLSRMETTAGRKVLSERRKKGRHILTVSEKAPRKK